MQTLSVQVQDDYMQQFMNFVKKQSFKCNYFKR